MPQNVAEILNLKLAWSRVRMDLTRRAFIHHPWELDLVELDVNSWLSSLESALRAETYNPGPMQVCDVPKGNGLVRPGSHLELADRVTYSAAVGAVLPAVITEIAWATDTVDFSSPLTGTPDRGEWILRGYARWKDFADKSLALLDEGYSHVVIADIAGYYENIDIKILSSDLRSVGAPDEVVNLLSRQLNTWSHDLGRGLPQGNAASDILAKLFLNTVDRRLRDAGFVHYRYNDDFRIFCRSATHAREALVELIRVLRERGLILQSAKSGIHLSCDARVIIEGVQPVIAHVAEQYAAERAAMREAGDPYAPDEEVEGVPVQDVGDVPVQVIRRAYDYHFIAADKDFDKSLFRYLLKRLAPEYDQQVMESVLEMLISQPQETHTILKFFSECGSPVQAQEGLAEFVSSTDAVYHYQVYQIHRWFSELSSGPIASAVADARKRTFDHAQPDYLRAVCLRLLADHGSSADLERIAADYPWTANALQRSEVICALRRMEKQRRNSFVARFERGSDLTARAARWVKTNAEPPHPELV